MFVGREKIKEMTRKKENFGSEKNQWVNSFCVNNEEVRFVGVDMKSGFRSVELTFICVWISMLKISIIW